MTDTTAQVDPTPIEAAVTQDAPQVAQPNDDKAKIKELNHEAATRRHEAKMLADKLAEATAKLQALEAEATPLKEKASRFDQWKAEESARRDAIAASMPEHFKAIYDASSDETVKQKAIEAYLTATNQPKVLPSPGPSMAGSAPPQTQSLAEMSSSQQKKIAAQGQTAAKAALDRLFGRA